MTEPPDIGSALLDNFDLSVDLASPLEAEAQLSSLLGMVWAGVDGPRDEAMAYFCAMIADQVAGAGSRARPLLELLAKQAPPQVAAQIAEQAARTLAQVPAWVPMLGTVELTRILSATAPPLGTQENVVLEFGHRSDAKVRGRHMVVLLLDYDLQIVKDAFMVDPSITFAEMVRQFRTEPGLLIDTKVTPDDMAQRLLPLMSGTEQEDDVMALGEALVETWHLLTSRVRDCLPSPGI